MVILPRALAKIKNANQSRPDALPQFAPGSSSEFPGLDVFVGLALSQRSNKRWQKRKTLRFLKQMVVRRLSAWARRPRVLDVRLCIACGGLLYVAFI